MGYDKKSQDDRGKFFHCFVFIPQREKLWRGVKNETDHSHFIFYKGPVAGNKSQ
jgi:hypothetical protein